MAWPIAVRYRPVVRSGAVLGVLVAMSAALASCGGSSHRAGVRGPSEVRAEPVSKAVANPFTSAVGQDTSGVTPPPAAGGANGPATYRGDLPGLYGGTRNHSTCDAQKLVTFLDQNPAKATAWASTLGIGTTQIRTYVSGLTAVTLRTDTRVTNHGFVDGRANPIQSVLEAGTAVFVNRYGEPVVKCYCGNPLTSPVLYTTPTYVGPLWSGFSSTHITIIDRSTTIIDTFTLVDLSTGKTFQQPAGTSARTGGAPSGTGQPGTPAPPAGQPSPQPQGQASTPGPAAENPSASFSPSSGHQGDTFTLTASGFRPGATLHVTLTRPDGVVEDYSITTGSDGSGSHTFANTANVVTGTYHATIANPATGAQAEASVDVAPASSP